MKIIKKHDSHGWVTVEINGFIATAKVFDEGSVYGIDEGRISKLSISSKVDKQVYNYDRGLEFSNIDSENLDLIIAELNTLPTSEEA